MHTLTDFKRELPSALKMAAYGTGIIGGAFLLFDLLGLSDTVTRDPGGLVYLVLPLLTIFFLSWKSALSIAHNGYQRILTSIGVLAFVLSFPLTFSTTDPLFFKTSIEIALEALVGGFILSTAAVGIPQIAYAFYRWIREGFDERA